MTFAAFLIDFGKRVRIANLRVSGYSVLVVYMRMPQKYALKYFVKPGCMIPPNTV